MDLPQKFLDSARAIVSAYRDRVWLEIEDHHAEIQRISVDGFRPGDEDLVQEMAKVLSMELYWRIATRCRLMQGRIEGEDI